MTTALREHQAMYRTSGTRWPERYAKVRAAAASYGLLLADVPGDGDCLYHGLVLALSHVTGLVTQQMWRDSIAFHLESWIQDPEIRETLLASLNPNTTLEQYLAGIRGREWGDHNSLIVACKPELGDCTILVWSPTSPIPLVVRWGSQPGHSVYHFLWTNVHENGPPMHYELLTPSDDYDSDRWPLQDPLMYIGDPVVMQEALPLEDALMALDCPDEVGTSSLPPSSAQADETLSTLELAAMRLQLYLNRSSQEHHGLKASSSAGIQTVT
eukprot:CAMPEP_0181320382 /NCGR_PEP_ID=MMETSP1101-20121128/18096_1 /TAXON_ID=46948 /ORGANISM="Rhodomonas abbreviata, Strain Caron Lab Isolate" /LENGTH=269 /DNA_ID=CAMNT_0023428087 /DNA_START=915 /DNA_END=1721 /DNA_ORIENTATION=-